MAWGCHCETSQRRSPLLDAATSVTGGVEARVQLPARPDAVLLRRSSLWSAGKRPVGLWSAEKEVYKDSVRRPLGPFRNLRLIGNSMPLGFVEIQCNRINVLSMLGVARVCSNFIRFFVPGRVPEA